MGKGVSATEARVLSLRSLQHGNLGHISWRRGQHPGRELLMPALYSLRLVDGDTTCMGKVYYNMLQFGEALITFPARAARASGGSVSP